MSVQPRGAETSLTGSFAPILLKKSFWGGRRNFLEPLMRFVRDDVRDLVASQKNDHGLSYRHYGAPNGRVVQELAFAKTFGSFGPGASAMVW